MNHMKTMVSWSILLLMIGFFTTEGIAHGWMAPKKAANVKNPVVLDNKSIERGRELYSRNCAACHGDNIEGLDAEAAGLEMSPPNLKKRLRTHSDGDFFWKIKEGRGDMPSFNDDLSDNQVWQTINYIRSEAE
jgi:mono/diheme cytochrome c family protein